MTQVAGPARMDSAPGTSAVNHVTLVPFAVACLLRFTACGSLMTYHAYRHDHS
jgi:hypothetical protein